MPEAAGSGRFRTAVTWRWHLVRCPAGRGTSGRAHPRRVHRPGGRVHQTADGAGTEYRRHPSSRADPCQSSAQRAALQGPIPPTNGQQTIKKPDYLLV